MISLLFCRMAAAQPELRADEALLGEMPDELVPA
jgi:hypothetical protein